MVRISSLAAVSLMTAGAWGLSLESNRKLIHTDNLFPADKYILDQACVMVELYYRMDEDEALLYDPEEPSVVFAKVPLRNLFAKQAEDSLSRFKQSLKRKVRALTETPADAWTDEQKSLRHLFPSGWDGQEAAASADRVVSRRGLRKAFRMSLERSYQYDPFMDSVFKAYGVPTRLKNLAHIETWFEPSAVSKAGAAGIFQFLASSGARYLNIDDRVDQRMDPIASTFAAARFLRDMHAFLHSWSLSVMAYNNGSGQISDAIKETGSHDASEIIQNFEANGFGTVSRTYYAMFLAASSLAANADALFPGLHKMPPLTYKTLKLEHEWTPSQLRVLSGYSTAVIRRYNPALRPDVFDRNLAVPKGFELRLPVGLPSSQDLQFADLRIDGDDGRRGEEPRLANSSVAGVPVPVIVGVSLARIRKTLFPARRAEDIPVMAYMHSQGLLDAERLALARKDNILIEPHPALAAMLRKVGG
jgi:membrane-bound lytic murein transglycosylase D